MAELRELVGREVEEIHATATELFAPVRSLVQRLGPHVEEVKPVVVTRGDQVDPIDLVERLVLAGYRREP